MKVYQDGKELKKAKVLYSPGGQPALVEIDGVSYDPSAFELKDSEPKKKTRSNSRAAKPNSEILSTEDVKG